MLRDALTAYLGAVGTEGEPSALEALRLEADRGSGTDPDDGECKDGLTLLVQRLLLAKVGGPPDRPVYSDGAEGFEIFIRRGSNVGLYEAVRDAFKELWSDLGLTSGEGPAKDWSLLDVGTGSGMGLLPAWSSLEPSRRPKHLTLLEPSAEMLKVAEEGFRAAGASADGVDIVNGTVQAFPRLISELKVQRWTLATASFSLQSLPKEERLAALRFLRDRCTRLAIVEFDVAPAFSQSDNSDAERTNFVIDTYARGVAEYGELGLDGMKVIDGFLVPVFLGYFGAVKATNYEQAAQFWEDDLKAAGWSGVTTRRIFDYWWSPAVLILAEQEGK